MAGDNKAIELLIKARMWIADELKEIGEANVDDEVLLRSIDNHLLEQLGPKRMINSFGLAIGYHDDPRTKAKRQEWREAAASGIRAILVDYTPEVED